MCVRLSVGSIYESVFLLTNLLDGEKKITRAGLCVNYSRWANEKDSNENLWSPDLRSSEGHIQIEVTPAPRMSGDNQSPFYN